MPTDANRTHANRMRAALAFIGLVLLAPAAAGALNLIRGVQAVPGCHEGFLTDPQAYFGSLVGATTPQTVDEALVVLGDVRASLLRYGILVQHDSAGTLRLRLHLPTGGPACGEPNAVCHDVDVYDIPTRAWQWVDRGGAYAPAPCGSTPPPPLDDAALLAQVRAVRALLDDLAPQIEQARAESLNSAVRALEIQEALRVVDAHVQASAKSLEEHRAEGRKLKAWAKDWKNWVAVIGGVVAGLAAK